MDYSRSFISYPYRPINYQRPNLSCSDISLSNHMKRIIAWINSLFISILLVFFYLFIISFGKLIFLLSYLFKKRAPNTYWEKHYKQKFDPYSPY